MLSLLRPVLTDALRLLLIAGVVVTLGVGIRAFFVPDASDVAVSRAARSRLTRSRHKALAGVCAGVAEYFGWSAGRTRLVYFLFTFLTGVAPGMLLYAALWFLMPSPVAGSD